MCLHSLRGGGTNPDEGGFFLDLDEEREDEELEDELDDDELEDEADEVFFFFDSRWFSFFLDGACCSGALRLLGFLDELVGRFERSFGGPRIFAMTRLFTTDSEFFFTEACERKELGLLRRSKDVFRGRGRGGRKKPCRPQQRSTHCASTRNKQTSTHANPAPPCR